MRFQYFFMFSWLALTPSQVLAVSSGYLGSGGMTNLLQSEDTGFRQRVELRSFGGLLAGRPQASPVVLISIHAPNVSTGHVLLREIRHSPNEVSLLLISPPALESAVQRATIFIKKNKPSLALWEWIDGEWQARAPMRIHVAENRFGASTEQTEILAFSVDKLGLYFLSEADSLNPLGLRPPPWNLDASSLLGGDIFRGLLPGLSALFAVVAGVLLSVCWHHREKRIS